MRDHIVQQKHAAIRNRAGDDVFVQIYICKINDITSTYFNLYMYRILNLPNERNFDFWFHSISDFCDP